MISVVSGSWYFPVSITETPTLTAGEVKALLIEKGVLPCPEEVKAAFWSLGEAFEEGDWWLQNIDGRYNRFGRWVFDKGLHRGHVEPNYLKGVWNASHHFIDHLHEGFGLKLYGDTHHIACAHFEKKAGNGIICNKDEIDNFRKKLICCNVHSIGAKGFEALSEKLDSLQYVGDNLDCAIANLKHTLGETIETKQEKLNKAAEEAKQILSEQLCSGKTPQEICDILSAQQWEIREDMKSIGEEHAQELNEHFKALAKRLDLKIPFVKCSFSDSDNSLHIVYSAASDVFDFEAITEKLISEFNCNLEILQRNAYGRIQSGTLIADVKGEYQEKVIPLIAELYAELEWVHPWIDGQGRTDIISLNGLLCREGLHPCILTLPYFSTSNPLNLWVDYLKEGLAKFKETKEGLASETMRI